MKILYFLFCLCICTSYGTREDLQGHEAPLAAHPPVQMAGSMALSEDETQWLSAFLNTPSQEMNVHRLGLLKRKNPGYFESGLQADLTVLGTIFPNHLDCDLRIRFLPVLCGWRQNKPTLSFPDGLQDQLKKWSGESAAWRFKVFLEGYGGSKIASTK